MRVIICFLIIPDSTSCSESTVLGHWNAIDLSFGVKSFVSSGRTGPTRNIIWLWIIVWVFQSLILCHCRASYWYTWNIYLDPTDWAWPCNCFDHWSISGRDAAEASNVFVCWLALYYRDPPWKERASGGYWSHEIAKNTLRR